MPAVLLTCFIAYIHMQTKPMVDLQSERNSVGHVVLTSVLFPQQELDDASNPAGMYVLVLVCYYSNAYE